MTEKDVYKRLESVFRDVFDDEDIKLTPNTTSADIEDWDSIEHINLVGAVEDEFGIRFSMGEVSGMKNVGEMVQIIIRRAK